jgi:hypothetical protein
MNKPTLITNADITYTSNYVNRINTELTTEIGGKALATHTHIIGDITSLQTALDGKALTSHTHTNVSGLQLTSHTHTIANVSGLQTALDGKAPTSHTHVIGDVRYYKLTDYIRW